MPERHYVSPSFKASFEFIFWMQSLHIIGQIKIIAQQSNYPCTGNSFYLSMNFSSFLTFIFGEFLKAKFVWNRMFFFFFGVVTGRWWVKKITRDITYFKWSLSLFHMFKYTNTVSNNVLVNPTFFFIMRSKSLDG